MRGGGSLTRRQKQVLDFLRDFIGTQGYAPSFEEIAAGLGLRSLATVHKHIATLNGKGYLRHGPNRRRSLEVLDPASQRRRARRLRAERHALPLLGRIAAGRPIEAVETRATISLADVARGREVFALQVQGDSMVDEHIVPGDYVLVEPAAQATAGDLVVALVDQTEATLKRYYPEANGLVRLQPANAAMSPLRYPAARVTVQGRVVAVLRTRI
ncbi:MAG: transcriptional repressor LexA [Terriglobales bacterium]